MTATLDAPGGPLPEAVPGADAAGARHPLGIAGLVELAALERGGMVESRHLGAAVVTDARGVVIRSLGDTGADIYPRSSLKPLQALAVMESGVRLEGEQAVLATASHSGTDRHLAVVRDMLGSVGLDESALRCPAAWPGDAEARDAARRGGLERRRVAMNCSGKHAAFLMACVRNGWSLDDYLEPGHPVQRAGRTMVEKLTGEPVGATAVDGCGAPVLATTLRALATGIARITGAVSGDAATLTDAVLAHPWAIDGPGRANTIAIDSLGALAKGGAEGVLVVGTRDGVAVAVKVIDGSARATTAIAITLLASVGAVDQVAADEVIAATTDKVLGGDRPAGRIRVSF